MSACENTGLSVARCKANDICDCFDYPGPAIWCYCFAPPEPDGPWIFPDDTHADTHGIDGASAALDA